MKISADVVVVGSGGAGLLAAVMAATSGASVVLLEAAATIGGTTALSGGMLWIPCNTPALRAGVDDSPEAAELYLSQLCKETGAGERIRAYVESAPRMLDLLLEKTAVRMAPVLDFPDYRQASGSRAGRSLDQEPFPLRELGPAADLVDASQNVPLTMREVHDLRADRATAQELVRTRRDAKVVTCGAALIAGLLATALDAEVSIRTGARVTGVTRHGPTGYEIALENGETVAARDALILATGGFEWDDELARGHLGVVPVPLSVPTNRGDALRWAPSLGAAITKEGDAWWIPVYLSGETPFLATRPLALPGSMLVDTRGRRFTNEAMNYYDQGPLLRDRTDGEAPAGWLLFDSRFKDLYPLPGLSLPSSPLVSADGLKELAAAAGLPVEETMRTVADFNDSAAAGVDPWYGRGHFDYDRYHGDPRNEPNPSVAPLDQPPFHALPIRLGVLGTNSGLVTNLDGQVMDTSGQPIPGLYGVGNVAGSMLGRAYPGAGGTLGPGMTAAYRAVRHLQGLTPSR